MVFPVGFDYSNIPSAHVLWVPVVLHSNSVKGAYKIAFFCQLSQDRKRWMVTAPGPQQNIGSSDQDLLNLMWAKLEEVVVERKI
jgi:hypothetical protein